LRAILNTEPKLSQLRAFPPALLAMFGVLFYPATS